MAPSAAGTLLALAVCAVLLGEVSAADHIVGGSFGWKVPPNATFYQEWAKSKTFELNDRLVFLYTSAIHNVLEVSEADFDGCTQDKVIGMHPVGPTTVSLTKGSHYYFCGIGTHCDQGLKLSITVGKTAATGADDDGASDSSSPADASTSSATMLHYLAGMLGLVMLPHLFV
ncbi:unnamed protein product [Victoria cruziana]